MKKKVDIYSEEFEGKIGFITRYGFLWMLKINLPGIFLILCVAIGILFLIDLFNSFISGVAYQWALLINLGLGWIYIIGFISGLFIGARINTKLFYRKRKFNQDGDTEKLGNVTITHHFVEAESVTWHYVEAGPKDADVIVFLHGIPESWFTWRHQIEDLSGDFHIYAFDLKGYGQSEKKIIGNYTWEAVTDQFLAVMDKLGLQKINFVCHDRGSVLIDYLGGTYPDRVKRYIRGQQVLHKWNPIRTPQEKLYTRPIIGTLANRIPRIIIPYAYARWYSYSKIKIPRKEIKRAIYEFSYPKLCWCVPLYFRTNGFAKDSFTTLRPIHDLRGVW